MPSVYQPRRPRASPLWQLVHHGWADFLADYEKHHRKSLGPLRPTAVATVQSFLRCGDLAAALLHLPPKGQQTVRYYPGHRGAHRATVAGGQGMDSR